MTDRSKKLNRQFAKILEAEDVETRLDALARGLQAKDGIIFEQDIALLGRFPAFFASVDKSYEDYAQQTKLALHNLERSSDELNEVNARLEKLNLTIATMLNTLGLGIFSFDSKGICSTVYSKACQTLMEGTPAGRSICDVLRMPSDMRDTTSALLNIIFSGNSAAFNDELFELLPHTFPHSQGLSISIAYRPIFDFTCKMQSVLVIATDHTEERVALELGHKREAAAQMVLRMSSNRNMFTRFFQSVHNYFTATIYTLPTHTSLEVVRREVHTLKGNASIFYLQDLIAALHRIENALDNTHSAQEAISLLHAEAPKVIELIAEVRNEATKIFGDDFDRQGSTRTLPVDLLHSFATELKHAGNNRDLYNRFVALIIGEPIRKQLVAFDIGLQELAERYERKIAPCVFTGEDFPLLTEKYDALFSALTHISRNIVAHAVDCEEARKNWGKPTALTVTIDTRRFERMGKPWFSLIFTDDGQGIDVVRLRKKLKEMHGEAEAAGLSNDDVLQSIFGDNMSTREEADELAGRGVGTSAVKFEVERLGGTIRVESELNRFTRTIIEVPVIWGE